MSSWLPSLFIKGSDHKYIHTKYIVLNMKLVITKEHMLEAKNKNGFSLYVCAKSRHAVYLDVVILWATHE